MKSPSTDAWSAFWQHGHVTTFGAAFANNYQGTIRQVWQQVFSETPPGAHILDIAAGNGAIARLAAEISVGQNKDFTIFASDIADIAPVFEEGDAAQAVIHFLPNTPCDKQPLADAQCRLICSQFGFEYSDVFASLGEIQRLLKPGGEFHCISHHPQSDLLRQARDDIAVYQSALQDLVLFGRLEQLLIHLQGSAKPPTAVSADFNGAMNQFIRRFGHTESGREIIQSISHIARSAASLSAEARQASVAGAYSEFNQAQIRLMAMCDAALDTDKLNALSQHGSELQLRLDVQAPLSSVDGKIIGWRLRYRKPA